jgi:DNA helicase-2/ATP-dependent DNA helicase PcrA
MQENLESFGLKSAAITRIRAFSNMILSFSHRSKVEDAQSLAASIASDSGLYLFYKSDSSMDGQSRTANVEELLNSVAQFKERRDGEYLEGLVADGGISDVSEVDTADYPLVTMQEYLEDVSLLSNVDVEEGEVSNKVSLMTAHSAKGLEFPYVFISGLEENLFPSVNMINSTNDLEEERRLFYVALTRAKKAVSLTYATTRMRNGKHENNPPSRFLREIDSRYLANPLRHEEDFDDERDGMTEGFSFLRSLSGNRAPFSGGRQGSSWSPGGSGSSWGSSRSVSSRSTGNTGYPGASSISRPSPIVSRPSPASSIASRPLPPKIPDSEFVPMPMDQVRVGMTIEHNRFGLGKVLELTGQPPELKAKISFEKYGDKILLLKYAKIRLPLL